MAAEPYTRLRADASPADLGTAIRTALSAFRDQVPHPTTWVRYKNPLPAAAGFRSNRLFHHNAVMCSVEDSDIAICFTPTQNGGSFGPGRGFQALFSLASTINLSVKPREIGLAAMKALALSIPFPKPDDAA